MDFEVNRDLAKQTIVFWDYAYKVKQEFQLWAFEHELSASSATMLF